MMKPTLAIVIPAYKPDFLRETLKSIQDQTNQNFSLYIFDDASPNDLGAIIEDFSFSPNFTYKCFEVNLGQHSLVQQWERCISETNDEEWIWVFSDDDTMASNCVESFYRKLEEKSGFAAYRFKTKKISSNGQIIRENRFPDTFDAADFLNLKLSYQQESYIVEYIFSREAYEAVNGFDDLPLAWTTDDLFCTKLAEHGEICSIKDGTVNWRYSESNISGKTDRQNALLKMQASLQFVEWILDHDNIKKNLNPQDLPLRWYVRQIRSMENQLSLFDELKAVRKMAKRDKTVWRYYLRMKKNRNKLVGWVKRFSS